MKSLGLFSIVYIIFALGFLVSYWPGDLSKSLSQNAARKKSSIIYYGIAFVPFLVFFTIFFLGWFIPEFRLPLFFSIVYSIGLFGQVVALVIPETRGWKIAIHRGFAFMMSLSLWLLTAMLLLQPGFSDIARIWGVGTAIYMGVCWALVIFSKKAYEYSLLFQVSYVLSFLIFILLATYTV